MRRNVLAVMMLLRLVMMGGEPGTYQVDRSAQIPLSLMNDMNTAQSIAGDHIFGLLRCCGKRCRSGSRIAQRH
jgi:hypothetical protein